VDGIAGFGRNFPVDICVRSKETQRS